MREEILKVISMITKIDEQNLDKEASNDRSWNSLTHVELVIALEEHFQIFFEPEEIAAMSTVNKVIELVERKVK